LFLAAARAHSAECIICLRRLSQGAFRRATR